jgi:hypothetical protein
LSAIGEVLKEGFGALRSKGGRIVLVFVWVGEFSPIAAQCGSFGGALLAVANWPFVAGKKYHRRNCAAVFATS